MTQSRCWYSTITVNAANWIFREIEMKKETKQMNRRQMLKLTAAAGAGVVLMGSEADANAPKANSKEAISKKNPLHIAIIGGGMAGTALAYRLSRAITYPVITLYEPQERSCWYQPGLTMLGTGLWPIADLSYERNNYIPMHVTLKKEAVTAIDPDKLRVTEANGKEVHYDYIIVATGLQLDFDAIEGLGSNITSLERMDTLPAWMNDEAIGSVYYLHGAFRLSLQLDKVVQKAQKASKKEKLHVYFTQPDARTKSPAAAKSVLLTLTQRLEKANLRDRVAISFVTEDGKLSENKHYNKRYRTLMKKEGISVITDKLTAIDAANQKATFEKEGTLPYDFIHITPPMKAADFLETAGLLDENGLVNVDKNTLEHKAYPKLFAIGDVAGCDTLKSASAISEQVKIITDTVRAIDEGDKPKAHYDGYGSDMMLCPEKKAAMIEAWNYKGNPLSPLISLDPMQCHGIYWYTTLYLSKTYMMQGVLRGWA